ncbi:hypothetical protein EYF80_019045 [Liparis tanakae]|uniref:Uncharacterized protein n=1 Tax=Liparis tanakae TaxID=230148 RepID=A0A4Z2I0J6_9TELE|nr:hypothetical protein EYF80_019045 [Liparis tanakae]
MTSRDQLSPILMGWVGLVGILLSFSEGLSKEKDESDMKTGGRAPPMRGDKTGKHLGTSSSLQETAHVSSQSDTESDDNDP